jgi:hypothetical protein
MMVAIDLNKWWTVPEARVSLQDAIWRRANRARTSPVEGDWLVSLVELETEKAQKGLSMHKMNHTPTWVTVCHPLSYSRYKTKKNESDKEVLTL